MNSHPNTPPIFEFYPPHDKNKVIGLLSIPHSGEWIPDEFHQYLTGDQSAYQEDVDYKVNELVDIRALTNRGIAVLVSTVHRVACDLNRPRDKSVLHWVENTKGRPMVKSTPSDEEIKRMELKYHAPYFDLLKDLFFELKDELKEKRANQRVSFVDLHSMPSRPTAHHLKQNPNQPSERPCFCLSDLKGKSCTAEYIQNIKKIFEKYGYAPEINNPYFGGYITQFAETFPFINGIQIETNRSLYMDEVSKKLILDKSNKVKEKLTALLIEHFENNFI